MIKAQIMGPLLQIAWQFFFRITIALAAWSFTFIGHNVDLKFTQSTSSLPRLDISPIFVQIDDKNVDVEKNKIISTTTNATTSTKIGKSKKTVDKNTAITNPRKTTSIPLPPVTEKKSTNETPSLNNLPIPNIELPNVTDEINRGTALGEWNNIYTNSKESIVNIFCVSTKENMVSISTGSGVIINKGGIILTNSHVAENFLIPDRDCSIRQGEIATDKYKASLIYINENWLKKNAGVLFQKSAKGTGENDFALLSINSKIEGGTIDTNISHTNLNLIELNNENIGNKILVAGYPASTLGILSLRKYLNFVADVIDISNVYTLDGTHIDVFDTGTTKVGQHGSSGGGIFNSSNNLIGLIVSVNDESGNSKVNALTTTYISRTLKNETGKNLQEFISADKSSLLASFLLKQNTLYGYVEPFLK